MVAQRPCNHGCASAGQYGFNQTGDRTCYSADEYESGFLHHTKIGTGFGGPLPPAVQVFYRCGDPDLAMSPEFSFVTQPEIGPASLPYRCRPLDSCCHAPVSPSALAVNQSCAHTARVPQPA